MTQPRATPRLPFDLRMDATLVSIVKDTHCSSWMHRAELFRRTSGVHKTAKQLRERFTEHINPDRNYDAFDEDESAQLVRLFRKFGPMWSHLASLLRGRTAGRVKNEMMKQISRTGACFTFATASLSRQLHFRDCEIRDPRSEIRDPGSENMKFCR